ncbi:MAG: thiamine phosphate synthase [Oscillospiraceae bacterium]|nr:thiamine phosphate synthase [Oscillospiraceae bacterium]
MKVNVDYSLYLCTDRTLMTSATIEESVKAALEGGVTLVQLREKNCSGRAFYELGLRVKKITDAYGVPLIINDRADIALAVGAAGVHVGQSDLPCKAARALMGKDKIVGVSVRCLQEALQAEREGADYIGVGAVFATRTKDDAAQVTAEELRGIRKAVRIPVVAIGGVNRQTLPLLKDTGIDGVAVVSAIVSQPDEKRAAEELLRIWKA